MGCLPKRHAPLSGQIATVLPGWGPEASIHCSNSVRLINNMICKPWLMICRRGGWVRRSGLGPARRSTDQRKESRDRQECCPEV
eukprot:11939722-Alexandrium_andersonii.AAC.1